MVTRSIINNFFIIIFTLLFFSSVDAYLIISSDSNVSLCSGGVVSFPLTVFNNDSLPHDISVSKSGVVAEYATIFPSSKQIPANSSADFIVWLVSPSKLYLSGELALSFNEFPWSIPVSFNNCHAVSLTPDDFVKNTCVLSAIEFRINVSNSGYSDEVLNFDFNGIGSDYSDIAFDRMIIARNSSEVSYVFFWPQKVAGEYSIILRAFNDFIDESLPLKVVVDTCNDFAVSLPEGLRVCEGSNFSSSVNLKNIGLFNDTYHIKTAGDFILSAYDFSLQPNSSFNSSIIFSPFCDSDGLVRGSFNFGSDNSLRVYNNSFDVIVDDCYSFNSSFSSANNICVCDYLNSSLTVFNNGIYEQDYSLSESSDYLSFAFYNFSLSPKTFIDIPFSFSSCTPGRFSVPVSVTEWSNCSSSTILNLSLEVFPENICKKPAITLPSDRFDLIGLTSYSIPVSVRNLGFYNVSYTIGFAGSAASWVYFANSAAFALSPAESAVLDLLVVPPEDLKGDFYELFINVYDNLSLLESKRVVFSSRRLGPVSYVVSLQSGNESFPFLVVAIIILLAVNFFFLVKFLKFKSASSSYGRRGKREKDTS